MYQNFLWNKRMNKNNIMYRQKKFVVCKLILVFLSWNCTSTFRRTTCLSFTLLLRPVGKLLEFPLLEGPHAGTFPSASELYWPEIFLKGLSSSIYASSFLFSLSNIVLTVYCNTAQGCAIVCKVFLLIVPQSSSMCCSFLIRAK